jgi:N-acetyl-D-muramate 6-phosphate phosphatase
VLFDFDGTLADTAGDLAAAVNRMRVKRGLEPLPAASARPYSSMGARGLLRIGFDMTPEDPRYSAMREEFLDAYGENVCVETCLFSGIDQVLAGLERRRLRWGIVTNKSRRFTERLVPLLGIRPDCVVCGDSTPHLKPHPAPLLLAAQQLDLSPESCIYVGDDLRDMQAARAAGMRCIAVGYGYHPADGPQPAAWNADALIAHPTELLEHL